MSAPQAHQPKLAQSPSSFSQKPLALGLQCAIPILVSHRVAAPSYWTHPSVRALKASDPVEEICSRAQTLVLDAIQTGWSGPPFDPIHLAELLKIEVRPKEERDDACLLPLSSGKFRIEFNPNRPKARIRYSIAHELAHTLFPDCDAEIRHRLTRRKQKHDDWQLEMLCNLAAAEILMPLDSFDPLGAEAFGIDQALSLRKTFDVSMEAILLRWIRRTREASAVFTASNAGDDLRFGYHLDYLVGSRNWPVSLPNGIALPKNSAPTECTAIGFTAKRIETWPTRNADKVRVECVGISPYPGRKFPRVVGIITSHVRLGNSAGMVYLEGDATEPRGAGPNILAHVVNDKTPNWGAAFGLAVRTKWPQVQAAFREWAEASGSLRLGETFHSEISPALTVFQMVCQRGYGPATKPGLRYTALRSCLQQLADYALATHSSIHMPRIGSGEAGGSWGLIQQLIDETLCARGLNVTVYTLPGSRTLSGNAGQRQLFG